MLEVFYKIYFCDLCLLQKDEIRDRMTQDIIQLEREFYLELDLQISGIKDTGSLLQILGSDSVTTCMKETSTQLRAISVQLFGELIFGLDELEIYMILQIDCTSSSIY